MSEMVEISRDGHVLEVRLNKPKVNAIDHEMSLSLIHISEPTRPY